MAIKVAIAGVGNCASSLVQGIQFYRDFPDRKIYSPFSQAGLNRISEIEIVAAFDVDRRKVNMGLRQAVFAEPNCTKIFYNKIESEVIVQRAPSLDGISKSLVGNSPCAIQESEVDPVDVSQALRDFDVDFLVCFLPVGSDNAVEYFANQCLESNVGFINCVPSFVASSDTWRDKFRQKDLIVIGDDIKSQVGATAIHRSLVKLLGEKGAEIQNTYQLNIGGNSDFLNMLHYDRLHSKKLSKTRSVTSQMNEVVSDDSIHIGPSDFVPFLGDEKESFMSLQWKGWCGVEMSARVNLNVVDSPNSAAIVADTIQLADLARRCGENDIQDLISSYAMKHPYHQDSDEVSTQKLLDFLKTVEENTL